MTYCPRCRHRGFIREEFTGDYAYWLCIICGHLEEVHDKVIDDRMPTAGVTRGR